MTKTEKKVKQRRGPTRFPGITEHARKLGVNRSTLWKVATGLWHLPGLNRRYQKLKEGK